MSDYESTAEDTYQSIEEDGAEALLELINKGEYDPKQSKYTDTSSETIQIVTVMTGYKSTDVDGVSVLRTDIKFLVPALGLPRSPRSGDKLRWQGLEYDVIDCATVQPGDTPVLHKVQGRL